MPPKPALAKPVSVKLAQPAAAEAKKATAKVNIPPARPTPQATVKIASAQKAAAPTPRIPQATVEAEEEEASTDSLTGNLAIAATVVAFAALGIQVWMFL
jgi:hypothetical protein